MSLLTELNITKDELKAVQDIAQSHPYFPELALNDYTFKASTKDFPKKLMDSLIDKFLVYTKEDKVYLVRALASKYWNDIVNSIPISIPPQITKGFLLTRKKETLANVYRIFYDKDGTNISKTDLIKEILKFYETDRKVNIMAEKKKVVKKENDENLLSPKQVAQEHGVNPTEFRKFLRKLYGKCPEGNWKLSPSQVDEVLEKLKEYKKEVAANRSERMAKLQEARKAKLAAKKEPAAKKASAKKSK